jgi:hypothetical protein
MGLQQRRHSILSDLALPDPVVDLHLGGEKGEGAVTPPSPHLVLPRLHAHWLQHKILLIYMYNSSAWGVYGSDSFIGPANRKNYFTAAVLQSRW